MPIVITLVSPRAAWTMEYRGGQPEFWGASHASIEPRRRRSVTSRHAVKEPHPAGGQGAWEPTDHRPRTLRPARPGCCGHLNKSGAWHRPNSGVSADLPSTPSEEEDRDMVVIGVDSHKWTHTVVAVDEAGRKLGERTVAATAEGHLELLGWSRSWPDHV